MKKRFKIIPIILVVVLALLLPAIPAVAKSFESGIAINYDGNSYYFHGMVVGDGWDIPGHEWVQAGKDHFRGKHYNSGPLPLFWSSDAPEGELLYVVDAIIDVVPNDLTPEKAAFYKARGYVHQHYLVDETGAPVPGMTAYLKHTARTTFTLTHGFVHSVTPGIDYEFPPNW